MTIVSNPNGYSEARYIYESPDGGKTVYARPAMGNKRILVGTHNPDLMEQAKRANRLLSIFRKSSEDTTLRDALEALEALYILKYGDDENV